MGWGGWQGVHLDDVHLIRPWTVTYSSEKSHDCVKMLMIEANGFKNLTWLMPNKSQDKHVTVEKC
jgi:hypothetical protein